MTVHVLACRVARAHTREKVLGQNLERAARQAHTVRIHNHHAGQTVDVQVPPPPLCLCVPVHDYAVSIVIKATT